MPPGGAGVPQGRARVPGWAADLAYLLREGARIAEGAVGAVLSRVQLEALYGAPVEIVTDTAAGKSAFLPG